MHYLSLLFVKVVLGALLGVITPKACFAEFKFTTEKHEVSLKILFDDLNWPWSLAFLPDGSILITERSGRLKHFTLNGSMRRVTGVPQVKAGGQGGLLDVAVDSRFSKNQTIFLSFSEPSGDQSTSGTAVARAKLVNSDKPSLVDVNVIFSQNIKTASGIHFGSRIVIAPDNSLFVTVGDRGEARRAQNPFDHAGSLVRINPDGSAHEQNPYLNGKKGLPEIWSIGHRNAQGATWNYNTRSIWTVAHGARGGDEINHPEAGKNYGWPVISYGRHYSGEKIGLGTHLFGMEQPVYYWDPSIAPSGLVYYTGNAFPLWRGNLFVGALKYQLITRLQLKKGKVISEERLFAGKFGRVRDVKEGPEGYLYFLTDGNPGKLIRINPIN